jgi:hypothetical protein
MVDEAWLSYFRPACLLPASGRHDDAHDDELSTLQQHWVLIPTTQYRSQEIREVLCMTYKSVGVPLPLQMGSFHLTAGAAESPKGQQKVNRTVLLVDPCAPRALFYPHS